MKVAYEGCPFFFIMGTRYWDDVLITTGVIPDFRSIAQFRGETSGEGWKERRRFFRAL